MRSFDSFLSFGGTVLVRVEKQEEQKRGSLYVPDTTTEAISIGQVVNVGPGTVDSNGERIPIPVSKGESIVFIKNNNAEVQVNGETLTIIRENQILGIVTP